uniref:Uncharacterized protein n=1 Tax=Arundo donax TaxID=35708 RepID=A0A0A9HV87_ARUDO
MINCTYDIVASKISISTT